MAGRRARPPARRRQSAARIVTVLALLIGVSAFAGAPVFAQNLTFPQRPSPKKSKAAIERENAAQKHMLVQAKEINYDYVNHRVAAVGNVQIYYGGSTIEADKVIYDERSKRLHAEGNVRLSEADGKTTYGDVMDLSDDYRNGFVDSLRLDAPDQTRMAAARAERTSGNYTVFHNGVYTACAPCKDDPKKPPEWQVKAARIIHDQGEKMIYFEDASLEFFGKPIAWMPYFSAPDPTVKRKTGVLVPSISSSSVYGQALEVPYYLALAPDYDATFAPMITTKQGPLLQGEFRQRLINGAYSIRGAGIYQFDKGVLCARVIGENAPGYRDFRGSIETSGQFALTDKWVWGWDGIALTDKTFLQDYHPNLSRYTSTDPFLSTTSEGTSQLYLTGKGNRSYFDVRSIYYLGFSNADVAGADTGHSSGDRLHLHVRPSGVRRRTRLRLNFTSLTRQSANFDADHADCAQQRLLLREPQPRARRCRQTACCTAFLAPTAVFRRRPNGAAASPISLARCSRRSSPCAPTPRSMQIRNDPGVSNFINTGDTELVRAMPTVGLEYRYPFISAKSWGTQTVEPIAQVIVRPNEPQVGRWPNEDAQSLVFDDSNLFRVDKFSGWDRVEGGGRANYGMQYTAQFNQGGFVNALFGQSYSLFGTNSFAEADVANTGLNSGLDTTAVRLRGPAVVPAQQDLYLHLALPFRPRHVRRAADRTGGERHLRPLECRGAVWRLRRAASDRVPRSPPGHSRHRFCQTRRQLGAARRRPLRH